MKSKQCDICGKEIKIDNWGNGKCGNCGWCNSKEALDYPNAVNPPNFVSYREAKQLYESNKKFTPDFKRCMELVDRGLDISFRYKKKYYQLSKHDDYVLWEIDTENYKTFHTLESFSKSLEIDGKNLEEEWKNVKYIRYDC